MNSCRPRCEIERRRPIARKAFGNLRSDGPDFARRTSTVARKHPFRRGISPRRGSHKWGNKPQERGRKTGFISNNDGTKLSRYARSPGKSAKVSFAPVRSVSPTRAQAPGSNMLRLRMVNQGFCLPHQGSYTACALGLTGHRGKQQALRLRHRLESPAVRVPARHPP
jgi:hypothetical protein